MTFKQALELGGCVRKGEHGSLVVYASTFSRTETDGETGEESERDIPFLKGYTVFNVEQIDGLPAHFPAPAEMLLSVWLDFSSCLPISARGKTGAPHRYI